MKACNPRLSSVYDPQLIHPRVVEVLEQLLQEVVLGAEPVIREPAAVTGSFADVFQRGPIGAVVADELHRRVEHPGIGQGGALRLRQAPPGAIQGWNGHPRCPCCRCRAPFDTRRVIQRILKRDACRRPEDSLRDDATDLSSV
jgi:hypothetical protein